MLCMILVIIAAKFTLNFIFERLKYISIFFFFFSLRFNKFASVDHLNGNFNNLILKKKCCLCLIFDQTTMAQNKSIYDAKIFSARCGPPRKQHLNL